MANKEWFLAYASSRLTISEKPQLSFIALSVSLSKKQLVVRRPPSGRPLTASRFHRLFIFLSTIYHIRILTYLEITLLITYRFTIENFEHLDKTV